MKLMLDRLPENEQHRQQKNTANGQDHEAISSPEAAAGTGKFIAFRTNGVFFDFRPIWLREVLNLFKP